MEQPSQLTEFGKVFIMLSVGILLVTFTLFLSRLIAPKKPNPLKLSSYECGEEPLGNSWVQFNPRFYVIALVFLLFDVEMIFIFPWSTIFGQQTLLRANPQWGWLTLLEMFVFVAILLLGLVYVWKKGDLEWIKPEQRLPTVKTSIPKSIYDRINKETYKIRAFDEGIEAVPENSVNPPTTTIKPAFKPRFNRKQP